MSRTFTDVENKLLNAIQDEVPLVERPFAAIGARAGLTEAATLDILRQLKSDEPPVIRQISAIFDTSALGYRSSLVAAKIDPHRLDEAAAIISAHPGVSHNYQRQHDYNLWYTLAVAPDSQLGLEKTIALLHQQSGALETRPLPTLKLFKIGVKLNLGGHDIATRTTTPHFAEEERSAAIAFPITEEDKRMIRVLQQDLRLVQYPYDPWAGQANVSPDRFLESAQLYQQQKRMRRFSAVLHHRAAGFAANAMGVWIVPAADAESFGMAAASFSAVSHCYLRPTYPDWPYNIFTMVHGPDAGACEKVLQSIAEHTGVKQYMSLYSTHEYKKVRVKYFTEEAAAWEARFA